MIRAGYAPLRVPRHQPLSLDVQVPNFDFSRSVPSFQVRMNPEAAVALIDLGRADRAGGDGVYLAVTFADGIPTTRILTTVSRLMMEALPLAKPIGSPLFTFYGLKLDGAELFGGPLTLEAQANHA